MGVGTESGNPLGPYPLPSLETPRYPSPFRQPPGSRCQFRFLKRTQQGGQIAPIPRSNPPSPTPPPRSLGALRHPARRRDRGAAAAVWPRLIPS